MFRCTKNTSVSSVIAQPFVALQMFIGLAIITTVLANAVTPEIPTVSDNENELGDLMPMDGGYDEKRSNWRSLQGTWGKRASPSDNDMNDNENLLPVLIAGMEPRSKLQLAYLTNAATLEHLANTPELIGNSGEAYDMDENILNEKRAWKSMNVAWGKRRNGPTWNKFRDMFSSQAGAWGKREPNWNNLKGMWGKRATWQKLHGGWGKRSSQQYSDVN
ncbi:allatostatins MIP isoform X1 [Musca domestica]|uniref:Allatostatins MIP isoform X1 n=1 Tax=Musca domestica TaxID=7370 RepID=A0A1I8N9C2_MUSDO|nr:allatostatins MIP isoform X1 [Musca domestica]